MSCVMTLVTAYKENRMSKLDSGSATMQKQIYHRRCPQLWGIKCCVVPRRLECH